MGKKLITKKNIHEFVDQSRNCLILTSNMILTPGAKDEAREKNYGLVYEQEVSQDANNSLMRDNGVEEHSVEKKHLQEKIREILCRDYGLNDEEAIQLLVNKILRQASS